jgi:hypothetical protein
MVALVAAIPALSRRLMMATGDGSRRRRFKSADDKLGKSQERWIRDNRERLHFPRSSIMTLWPGRDQDQEQAEAWGTPLLPALAGICPRK